MDSGAISHTKAVIDRADFPRLFDVLKKKGYTLIGPVVRDEVIVYDNLDSEANLPCGWGDTQEKGVYRLKRRADSALFGYNVGAHSWKRFLLPPLQRLFHALRRGAVVQFTAENGEQPKQAFIGVRACELRAIAIQDEVFLNGNFKETTYQSRRANAFIVAVNCGQAGGACFCGSMNTGPKAEQGFDLALTEVIDGTRHYFVVSAGTDLGAEALNELPHKEATADEVATADRLVAEAASQMGRRVDTTGLKELLYQNLEHPEWESVGARCLTCGNCTMVCPTCFCAMVEESTDLSGAQAERWRKWDSCFAGDFSYIHGGSVRSSAKARYRQWLVHKFAAWIDQFGSPGCVGCGRCITWCPAGIDITEEVGAIRGAGLPSQEVQSTNSNSNEKP